MNSNIILIVEDEIDSYTLLKVMLSKYTYQIVWVKDGESAIELCKNDNDIVLVLMDIRLPNMNGYDTTLAIKEFRPKLPIIAQTAYALQGDREKALEAKCDDYIAKPIERDDFITLMKKYLDI